MTLLSRLKQQLVVQLEEVKRQSEQESREKHSFNLQVYKHSLSKWENHSFLNLTLKRKET